MTEQFIEFSYRQFVDDVIGRQPSDTFRTCVNSYAKEVRSVLTQDAAMFTECYDASLAATGAEVAFGKTIRRYFRAMHLFAAYRWAAGAEGGYVECGVYRGFSAHLMMSLRRMTEPEFSGAGHVLVDSFEGLSFPNSEDAVSTITAKDGSTQLRARGGPGSFSASQESVKEAMTEYPDATFVKGWIPDVLNKLPEQTWKFVHIDLDLFAPTLGALEYFYDRLSPGGVIVNDDYYSTSFPGGGKAWKQFCDQRQIEFWALDTGQALLFKPRT